MNEISLVDKPANQHARVLLAKRDDTDDDEGILDKIRGLLGIAKAKHEDPEEDDMDPEEEDEDEDDDLEDDDLDEEDEEEDPELEKRATDAGNNSTEQTMKSEPTDVLKSLAPEARAEVEKKIKEGEEAVVELQKFREEKASRELISKATTIVGKANVKAEDIASVLKQLDEPGRAIVEDVLMKFNAAIAHGGLFEEQGSAGSDVTGSDTKLEKAADKLQAQDPKLSRPQAINKALELNPELYEDDAAEA